VPPILLLRAPPCLVPERTALFSQRTEDLRVDSGRPFRIHAVRDSACFLPGARRAALIG